MIKEIHYVISAHRVQFAIRQVDRVFVAPARTQCPDGWTTKYAGYLVSDRNHERHKRSNYICLDEAPEVAVGETVHQALIYPDEVQCGSLPCSVYPTGRELTCIIYCK